MGLTRGGNRSAIQAVGRWVRKQPTRIKAALAVITAIASLVFLRFVVHDHDNLFVASEAAHAIGIAVLIYKLIKDRTCAGKFGFKKRAFFPFHSMQNYACSFW